MKLQLDRIEIDFIMGAIDYNSTIATVKEAKSRVDTTTQRIDDLKKQLEIDEANLVRLEVRDAMVEKLIGKLI